MLMHLFLGTSLRPESLSAVSRQPLGKGTASRRGLDELSCESGPILRGAASVVSVCPEEWDIAVSEFLLPSVAGTVKLGSATG